MVMQKKIQKIHMNVLREDRKSIGNLLSNDSEGRAVLRLQFFCKFDIVSNLCYLSDEKIRKTKTVSLKILHAMLRSLNVIPKTTSSHCRRLSRMLT